MPARELRCRYSSATSTSFEQDWSATCIESLWLANTTVCNEAYSEGGCTACTGWIADVAGAILAQPPLRFADLEQQSSWYLYSSRMMVVVVEY